MRWELLPRTVLLAGKLTALSARWDLQPLADGLKAQHAAIVKLHFELLVPVGLRAAAPQQEQIAFRRQVTAVVRGSEATWLGAREFIRICTRFGSLYSRTLLELGGALIILGREVDEADQLTRTLLADLRRESAGAPSEAGRQGYRALAVKAAAVATELERAAKCRVAASALQAIATEMDDAREALLMILQRQTIGLVPSMLNHLSHLVAPRPTDTPQTFHQAQLATHELASSIDGALEQIAALQAYGTELGARNAAVQSAACSLRPFHRASLERE